jgi:hypothetical protein
MLRLIRYLTPQLKPGTSYLRCYSVELQDQSETPPDKVKHRKVVELEIDVSKNNFFLICGLFD